MQLPDSQPDLLNDLSSKLRGLTELLTEHCPKHPGQSGACADLLEGLPEKELLLLTDGQVMLERQGKAIVLFEPGDLLGLSRALKLPEGKLVVEAPVRFERINRDELITQVNASAEMQRHWSYYLVCLSTYFREALTLEKRANFQPATGFMSFDPGETIIAQGDHADCVYTLLEGEAYATRDGVKVGQINTDEVFGALAVFTRQPRNASVIAATDCSVMAVRKEDFIDLVEHQPQICISLIEEMADKINQLNQQLASTEAN